MSTALNPTAPSHERFLDLPEVRVRVCLSKSSIYEMLGRNPPAFPRPVKLSRRAVRWPESEISKWVADRIAQSDR